MSRRLRTVSGTVLANVGVALAYWALGAMSLRIVQGTGLAAPVWPSAGLAFALVYQYGPRLLPGVFLGSAMNNAVSLIGARTDLRTVLVVSAAIGLGAALQAQVGRILVHRKVGRHPSFVSPAQILWFLSLSGPLACAVNASFGVAAQLLGDVIPSGIAGRVWVTWWVGDTVGVVVFGVVALMLLPEQREVWDQRRAKVGVPAMLAVGMAIVLFLQGAGLADRQLATELRSNADNAGHALSEQVARITEILGGVRGLYLVSPDLSLAEFRAYTTSPLLGHPALQALSWNPVITPATRGAFEAHQQAQGLAGYHLTEKAADGSFVPVGDRAQYVPVGYIEPMDKNARALGYDIGSDPVRRSAIDAAIATGQATATAPIDLVQEPGRQKGVLVILPVFATGATPRTALERAAQVRGFAVGVYRLGDLMKATFAAGSWRNDELVLSDVTAGGYTVRMAASGGHVRGSAQPVQYRDLRLLGRTWRLAVTAYQSESAPPQLVNEPVVLVLGLILALVLMAFLLLLSGLERQARHEADIDPLTGLFNRRALLARLEQARRLSQTSGSTHALIFMDLDRFKPVNDTAGHAVGDLVLQEVAQVLRRAVRERDSVARIGGDEFAVVLLDCNAERGQSIAHEIIDGVRRHDVHTNGAVMHVGASVGVAVIEPPDPEDVHALLERADHASYVAKFAGGNRVVLATVASAAHAR